ncbi:XrtA/PEP-CTERM system TPR-repeat protein PrsT [Glaciecola siphonariae]|uniref:XrtA/PEP-CTERM system TPR-repeat protein PrsT n=1 Tax=Glaciecola siphonariae TaxID=521012 RepID=A0ABV9M1L6_9ALTE
MKHIFLVILIVPFLSLAQVEDNYEKANIAFSENQFDEAYIYLKNSLNEDANHLPSKILMGKVLAISFIYDDAIDEFFEALSAGADPNLVIDFLGNALLVEGRFEEAIGLSSSGLSTKNRALLSAIQAKANSSLGNSDEARSQFEQAINLDASNSAIFDAYAKFELSLDNIDAAISLSQRAIALDMNNVEAYRTLANAYSENSDVENYLASLIKGLEIDDTQPLLLRDLVSAYVKLERFEDAEQVLNKILSSSSANPMARLLLSWVQAQLGKNELSQNTLEDLVNYLSLIDSDSVATGDGLIYIAGLANYASGNIEAARQNLQTYITKQPQNFNASILLSDIYENEGSVPSAIAVLEKFRDRANTDIEFADKLCSLYIKARLNHKCTSLVSQLKKTFSSDDRLIVIEAKVLAARGKIDEALGKLDTVQAESERVTVEKAILALKVNKFEEAEALIKSLLVSGERNNDYLNVLAGVYIKKGDSQQAQALVNEILDKNPSHYSARFNQASLFASANRFTDSKRILEILNTEQPRELQVLLLLAKVEKGLGNLEQALVYVENALDISAELSQAKIEQAEIYGLLGNYKRALQILNPLVKDNFLDPDYLARRADLLIRMNDLSAAKRDLDTLFGIFANDGNELLQLSYFQRRANDRQGALKSIDRALELSPQAYFPLLEKVKLSLELGELDAAKSTMRVLKNTHDNTADIAMLRGDVMMAENQFDKATEAYQDAIEQDPNFGQALLKRYELAKRGFQTDQFIKFAEDHLATNSNANLMKHLLGDLYLEINQADAAKKHYSELLTQTRYRNLAYIMNNLANIYINEGDYQNAYELALKANERLPNNQAITDTLGWSLVKLNRLDSGLNYLRQAFAMSTADPAVRYHIGYTLAKLGRKSEAIRELTNLLEQFGDFKERPLAEDLLASLT